MKLTLRSYQSELLQTVQDKFRKGKKRIVLCAPTGAGKGLVISTAVARTLEKDSSKRVLTLTDRTEIFKQLYRTMKGVAAQPFEYNAQTKPGIPVTHRCVVSMIETLKRRHKANKLNIGNFDLIIIDEAHRANFNAIFDIYPDAYYIGATATPLSANKSKPMKDYYQDIANVIDIPELIEQGYLVPEQTFEMKLIDESQLKKGRNGDFTEKSQESVFNSPKLFAGLTSAYNNHAKGKKTIVFCSNIKMVEYAEEQLKQSASGAVYSITSKTSDSDRRHILDQFHDTKDGIMVNCGILTTGYDHPPIEVGIIFRSTLSLPLWLQMCGRVGRIALDKDRAVLIDLGGNVTRHGLWSDGRDWSKWFFNPPKKGEGVAPVKECPNCESILPASATLCQFCGHEFETKEKELQEGVLVEVKPFVGQRISELSIPELIELERTKRYKATFIWRVIRTKGQEALREYAHITGKKGKWVWYQMNHGVGFTDYVIK